MTTAPAPAIDYGIMRYNIERETPLASLECIDLEFCIVSKPIIFLEFNEIVPQLIDRFIADGRLPNFARFKQQSDVFVTKSDEPEAPNLEPWIQWYSLHTGIPFSEHGVFRLTDGLMQDHDDIWRILSRSGKRVMNISSMNARPFGEVEGSVYLPDPWCAAAAPYPEELHDFQNFVSRYVQEYTNTTESNKKLALRFMTMLATHGLSFSTVRAVAQQLIGEKLGNMRDSWQRAPLLDAMLLDIFRHYYRKNKPHFATFFINSTAHYQHAYWREMDPAQFGDKESSESPHKDAILYGYQCMDRLLAEFMKLEQETGSMLVLSSALSQQPFLRNDSGGRSLYYRFKDVKGFLHQNGIRYLSVEPVMTNQYRIHFESGSLAAEAVKKIQQFKLDSRSVIEVEHDLENHLYIGAALHDAIPESATVTSTDLSEPVGFYDIFYQLDVSKSGRHHPDGVLWFKTGQFQIHDDSPSILDILPTLLELNNVPLTEFAHLRGNSLATLLGTDARLDDKVA